MWDGDCARKIWSLGKHGSGSIEFFCSTSAGVSLQESYRVVGYIYGCSVPGDSPTDSVSHILSYNKPLPVEKNRQKVDSCHLQPRTPTDTLDIQCLLRSSSYQSPKPHLPWLPILYLITKTTVTSLWLCSHFSFCFEVSAHLSSLEFRPTLQYSALLAHQVGWMFLPLSPKDSGNTSFTHVAH